MPLLARPLVFFQNRQPLLLCSSLSHHHHQTFSFNLSITTAHHRRRTPAAFAISGGGSADGAYLPAVRTYESDLARLTVIGEVCFEQALAAAAADGGYAADRHLSSVAADTPAAMVIETVSPGSGGDSSSCTLSTRLFLPPEKVREKARELRSSLTTDILSADPAGKRDILAMTFRQVVMHRLWKLELCLFEPGIKEDIKNLSSPRKVASAVTLSSSDQKFLYVLTEVICSFALRNAGGGCLHKFDGFSLKSVFEWLVKAKRVPSQDSPISLYQDREEEIVKRVRSQMDKFNLAKEGIIDNRRKMSNSWWTPPSYSRLDRIEGSVLSDWTNEYIPAYRLQLDAAKFKDINLEGWKQLTDTRWEVSLTHSQMIDIANILDMLYEDKYTIPEKQLLSGLTMKISKVSQSKNSFWRLLSACIASGCIFIIISIVTQICWPQLLQAKNSSQQSSSLSVSQCSQLPAVEVADLDHMCCEVIKQIVESYSWHTEVMTDAKIGAWTGNLPSYLMSECLDSGSFSAGSPRDCLDENPSASEDSVSTTYDQSNPRNLGLQKNAQDLASYQVVLSGDGTIHGLQPTSRIAVNHWASNPLASKLYKGKLSPGLIEPYLRIPHPNNVVLIELLISVNPGWQFALARPVT